MKKTLYRIALQYASVFAMVIAVAGAEARSLIFIHEPKVPSKLQKD